MPHNCPSGCGAQVADHMFACRPCWFLLPVEHRRAITDTYRVDNLAHFHAMGDARRWYREWREEQGGA